MISKPWRIMLCVLLASCSVLYIGKGLSVLMLAPELPNDLRLRWVEMRYFIAGRDPNDAFFASEKNAALWRPLWTPRDASVLPEFGPPLMGGYPPWAFATGLLFYWPSSLFIARWWFVGVNLLAMGVLFLFGYRTGRKGGRDQALTLGLAGTAVSALCTTLGVGQCGIIVTALLVLCSWALQRQQLATGGFWLGLAAFKPILSGPFGLPFVIPLRPRALASVAVVLAVTSGIVWLWTGAPTLEMILQMVRLGQSFMLDSYGPINALHALGLPTAAAGWVAAAVCTAGAFLLLARWKQAAVPVHFAIAAVAARLWSYHHLYDNVILIFLLIALGDLAHRQPRLLHTSTFLAVGISLWAPGKLSDLLPFQCLQMAVWILGLGILLAGTPRAQPAEALPA